MPRRTQYVDLSQRLDANILIYPGDPTFSCCPALTLAQDGVNVHSISLGSHTGMHIDAPYHFVQDGQRIDELPLSRTCGPCLVVDVSGKAEREKISWDDIESYTGRIRQGVAANESFIVLVRTGWSEHWANPSYFDHPFLDGEVAKGLLELGVKTIGIDALSPDETFTDPGVHASFDVHHIILAAGGVIAENLTNLEQIQEGEWTVNMVPLKLGGCDGSPVRAFAYRRTAT